MDVGVSMIPLTLYVWKSRQRYFETSTLSRCSWTVRLCRQRRIYLCQCVRLRVSTQSVYVVKALVGT